jgi:CubicO group peptidase (beta-lactamase class C family)
MKFDTHKERASEIRRRPRMLRWAVLASFIFGPAQAQVSPALEEARRHVVDGNVNVLTFHSIDALFPVRRVETSGSPWVLPRAEQPLNFTYEYQGQIHPALDVLERTYTNALIVIKRGRILAEIYRNQTDASTHFLGWSVSKSITSVLIGLAIAEGSIHSADDPITRYVPELKDSAYDGVTIRQALNMRSGANYVEEYAAPYPTLGAAAFEQSFVENRMQYASFARAMKRAYPPGEHFSYSTFDTCVLGWVLERATRTNLSEFMSRRLWKPAGMESYGFWMLDGPTSEGREFAGGGFNAVARDYARLGLLILRNGRAAEHPVLPEGWVRESTRPKIRDLVDPDEPTFSYHDGWWPLVDSDAFMARGLQGQAIYIDPSAEMVVVKLSYFPRGNAAQHEAFPETMAFLKALSRWQVP